jgi:hypothetical protein
MEGGIESANKFGLIFPIEKGGESGSINFSLIAYIRKKLKHL